MGPLSRVAGGARLLGEPSARVRGWARGLAHAETRKAGDQLVPASGLGEVLATGWAVAGGGAPGSLFSQLRSAGWTRTCAHTHTHSLALSTWVVPASSWGLWVCLPEGTAGPRASRKWGEGWAPRRRGGEGLLRFQEAGRPGLVLAGPGGLSLTHLGSGVCGHSWVRLPSSLLVLTCWVSAGGVFLAPINAWARAPPPPTPQAGYDKGQWGHLE